jgi:uncharacterized membrane protein
MVKINKLNFAQHLFDGLYSIANVFGNTGNNETTNGPGRLDALALRKDWEVIGNDLRLVLQREYIERNALMEGDRSDEVPNLPQKEFTREELIEILRNNGLLISPVKIRQVSVSMETEFSGPIPAPHILAEYDKILPGCANRIITAFEVQYQHRMKIDKANFRWGGVLVLCCLGVTGWMGAIGHTILAGTIGTTTVVSLATIYFLGKRKSEQKVKSK